MLQNNNEHTADISVVIKEKIFVTIKAAELEIFVTTEKFFVATKNGR